MNELECPKPIKVQAGCKVSWYTYDKEADALKASAWAKVERERKWALGYDFGWLMPGEINRIADGTLWIVTMP
jgi:hypothetical protein